MSRERDPQAQINGNVFPPARQARGLTASVYWGDAGDSERPYSVPLSLNVAAGGQDTVSNRGAGSQVSEPFWGMQDAWDSFRYRFLNTLNLGKIIRPTVGSYMNGRSDMRPVAEAIHPRAMGEVTPVLSRTGGRMMAPGKVTRWEQASLVWPRFGQSPGVE